MSNYEELKMDNEKTREYSNWIKNTIIPEIIKESTDFINSKKQMKIKRENRLAELNKDVNEFKLILAKLIKKRENLKNDENDRKIKINTLILKVEEFIDLRAKKININETEINKINFILDQEKNIKTKTDRQQFFNIDENIKKIKSILVSIDQNKDNITFILNKENNIRNVKPLSTENIKKTEAKLISIYNDLNILKKKLINESNEIKNNTKTTYTEYVAEIYNIINNLNRFNSDALHNKFTIINNIIVYPD